MAYKETCFIQGQLVAASTTTYYTAPATVQLVVVKEILLCNTSTNPETITFYVIPSGQAASAQYCQLSGITLQPGETKIFGRTMIMIPGEFVQAVCSTPSKVHLSMNGVART